MDNEMDNEMDSERETPGHAAQTTRANGPRRTGNRQAQPRGARQKKQEGQQHALAPEQSDQQRRDWSEQRVHDQLLDLLEEEDEVGEAVLSLPIDRYRAWLERRLPNQVVGVYPSASMNPLALYIAARTGVLPNLHTDGQHAWFLLQLTKNMSGSSPLYLRLLLPLWTVPLTMQYTAYEVRRTSGYPREREITRGDALASLRHIPTELQG